MQHARCRARRRGTLGPVTAAHLPPTPRKVLLELLRHGTVKVDAPRDVVADPWITKGLLQQRPAQGRPVRREAIGSGGDKREGGRRCCSWNATGTHLRRESLGFVQLEK